MPNREFTSMLEWIAPVVVALSMILPISALREPARRHFSALLIAGAGATYISGGGFGPWEVAFSAVMSIIAYFGLGSYRAVAAGWLLHTAWDLAHHWYGNPILPFSATSSLGCAVCDPVLAVWYLAGAPSPWHRFGNEGRLAASRV